MIIRNICAFLGLLAVLATITAIFNEEYSAMVVFFTAFVMCIFLTAAAHIEEL